MEESYDDMETDFFIHVDFSIEAVLQSHPQADDDNGRYQVVETYTVEQRDMQSSPPLRTPRGEPGASYPVQKSLASTRLSTVRSENRKLLKIHFYFSSSSSAAGRIVTFS